MRFKAELFDPEALISILASLEKISNEITLVLEPENVHFRISRNSLSEENAFVQIPTEAMFDEYKIESKNNNIIGLAIRASNLIASIRTGKRSQRIVVKLSKKDRQPCLKIEVHTSSSTHPSIFI